jgi:hypothetical protein
MDGQLAYIYVSLSEANSPDCVESVSAGETRRDSSSM